jgi:glycosyltransferase involved in cell wall biosynthesis
MSTVSFGGEHRARGNETVGQADMESYGMDIANPTSDTGSGSVGGMSVKYSVIVPCYNEQEIIETVCQRITRVMRHLAKPYELILVNDGSKDGTAEVLARLAGADEHVLFIDLRRNFGKSAALQAGFDHCRGEIIITMDGDLQNDPYEIPLFIKKIDEGYDIASGRRVRRRDNLFVRRIPSRVANWLLWKVSGVSIRDFGGGYKAYRREVLENVHIYGDMMRFIPAICYRMGATVAEVPIKNVRRRYGKSNYGIERTFRVAMDLIMLRFISRYMTRPMHLFGKWGLLCLLGGGGIMLYGLWRKIDGWFEGRGFHLFREHGPLMAVGFALLVFSLVFFSTGIIGEMLMRVYFESTDAKTYAVRRLVKKGSQSEVNKNEVP